MKPAWFYETIIAGLLLAIVVGFLHFAGELIILEKKIDKIITMVED